MPAPVSLPMKASRRWIKGFLTGRLDSKAILIKPGDKNRIRDKNMTKKGRKIYPS
jgi:hypothetical protein